MVEFCERFGEPLNRLAERHIAPALRRRTGPESVVQSACFSFLRRAKAGQFQLRDSEELWRLLCTITLRKVRSKARFHLRGKRGIQREVEVGTGGPDDSRPALESPDPGQSPDQVAAVAEQFELLLQSLGEDERRIVELKLQEYTQPEIARQMGCSERTVRRLFSRIRDRLQESVEVD